MFRVSSEAQGLSVYKPGISRNAHSTHVVETTT